MALSTSALLDALFANAPIGPGSWGCDLRYDRVNPALAAINGVPIDAHVGRLPSELLPDIGEGIETTLRRVIDTGQPLRDIEVSGETPAAPGRARHWNTSYFPVRDGEGATAGAICLVIEVTAERHAEERSAFVDAELRSLYAALPVGVAFLSPDLRYQRVNETLAQINGTSVADHIGATLEDVVGSAAEQLRGLLVGVMETGESLEFEIEVPLPHDPEDVRALEAIYFPVVDGDGAMLGVGGVVRDVTERHALQTEQSRLLRDALVARAQAEAAQVRADTAREEAERSSERLALLALAGREMAGSMDWEATLRAVVRSAVPAVADGSHLTVVEPDRSLRVVAVANADPERQRLAAELAERGRLDPAAETGPAAVVRSGRLEVEHDITGDELGVRHRATAPLRAGAGVIGTLSFELADSGRSFSTEDLDLITSLAARAALHIQNARLYTERSHIAETLQTSLRPRGLPAIPGAELAARYLPAGEQDGAGGDFYDVFATTEGAWAAVIGDVSGKGPEAAAITALARHTLRATSLLRDDPSENLALLNRVLFEDVTTDFCTAVYARLRPDERGVEVRLANGGHPEPLVVRAGNVVEVVEDGRGPLVGGLPDPRFDETTLRLHSGDLLLLYTDGVTEVRRSDVRFGETQLRELVGRLAGAPASDIVAAVERHAVELQGGRPRDDIALVAVKATDGVR